MGKAVSPPQGAREAMWIAIAPSLRRSVAGSAGANEIDDLLQDVAERFLAKTSGFSSDAEALAWARVVARNRLIDRSRRPRSMSLADSEIPSRVDAEQAALDRMALDCARAYLRRHGISESWLLGSRLGEPVSAAERAEKSRLRRRLQAHVKEKIGWPALIPSWRWLTPAAVALAVVPIPLIAGLQLPETDSTQPDTPAAIDRLLEPSPAEPVASQQTVPSVPSSLQASPGGVPAPPDSVRMVASVPTPWGDAQWREIEPPRDGPPPPLFCAQNLRLAPDICVDHPLK